MKRGKYQQTEEYRKKVSGSGNSFYGKHHTKKTKGKISKTNKGKKRLPFSEEHKRKISLSKIGKKLSKKDAERLRKLRKGKTPWNKGLKGFGVFFKGKHHTRESKLKIGIAHRGEKNHNWKGGVTPLRKQIRRCSKYVQWRQSVFIKDDFTCQRCGNKNGEKLEIHHIKKSFSQLLKEVKEYMPLLPLYDAVLLYTPFWDISNGQTLCRECHKKTKNYGNKELL